MFKHNLLITYRSFLRDKSTFLINLIGLSTGLASVMLIFLWVNDEMSIDKFHENDERLYQIMTNLETPNGISTFELTPSLFAEDVAEKLPEIELATNASVSFMRPDGIVLDGTERIPTKGMFVNENFFDVFSYNILEGEKSNMLDSKGKAVISKKLANILYDSPNEAIGKIITWETQFFDTTFQVSGVFDDVPESATTQFDVVIQFDWLIDGNNDVATWSDGNAETYVVLKEGTDVKKFGDKVAGYLRTKHDFWGPSTLFTRKYSDKYLYGNFEEGIQVGGRISYVKQFSIIALFILLLSCINFMNLSTAQASKKMKEIGVKKALGGSRKMLIFQYFGETLIMVSLSVMVAGVIVFFLLPSFNELTGKTLELSLNLERALAILGIVFFTGIIAGSYPALYLSGFNPLEVLKGKLNPSTGEAWIRKGLVIFQFALSVIFIVGVLVIGKQMDYTRTKNLGYDRDNILTFQRPMHQDDPSVFLSEVKSIPGVLKASQMAGDILSGASIQKGYSWRGQEADEAISFKAPMVGYGTIETLGMELIKGRSFSKEYQDDPSKIILNESAVKMMGLENPIGKRISKDVYQAREEREVIGVVKDFHYGSLHHKVEPLVLRFRNFGLNNLVKVKAGTEAATIRSVEQVFKKFHPDYPFEFSFLDSDYQQLYNSESRVATLSKYFGILAIIISCLGLFGLTAFVSEQRSREIGIRKALGQGSMDISFMLSSEFAKLVLVSILFGLPIAYLVTTDWLSSFAYKIDLSPSLFLLSGVVVLIVAIITVSSQSLKAAFKNPIEALRQE